MNKVQLGVVGIAACYGLDGSGFKTRWGQESSLFHTFQIGPGALPASPTMVIGVLSQWESNRSVPLTNRPLSVPMLETL